jgi:glycolate oxidase FAD binding subunit
MTIAASTATTLGRDLESMVGAANVTDDPAALAQFAIDGVEPRVVVTPADANEVGAVLTYAHRGRLAVVPTGGMSHQHIGGIPERVDIVLRTTRLTTVEHYDHGDLTIGIGAGATIAQLNSLISANRQVLPTETANPEKTTIGGLLATNLHGPLKHGFGGARDWLIGVRFVTGDGKLAKAGGRVVKNVAGYDLMKLLIGSYGTLAVIVGASFKLFPAPRRTRTYVCQFATAQEALAFRTRIMHSPLTPLTLELISPHAQVVLTGEAGALQDGWRVLLRVAGSDAVLARYRAELGGAITRELDEEEEALLWKGIAEFPARVFVNAQNTMLVRMDLPPSEIAEALQAAERAASDNNFVVAAIGRVGVGAMLVAFCPIAVDPPGVIQYANTISDLRGSLSRHASAVVLRCPREAKNHFSVWGTSPTDLDAMKAIKHALDEHNILNPGRFLF